MKSTRTVVIADMIESKHDPEVLQIVDALRLLGLNVELIAASGSADILTSVDCVDLVIIDYGGMSFGASDTAKSHIRYACKFAAEHPGCLMVIWTYFTAELYRGEIEEQFGHVSDNIILYSVHDTTAAEQIQRWAGIRY